MNFMILYQLLPTTSIGNEWGQQMRNQILILGFKELSNSPFQSLRPGPLANAKAKA